MNTGRKFVRGALYTALPASIAYATIYQPSSTWGAEQPHAPAAQRGATTGQNKLVPIKCVDNTYVAPWECPSRNDFLTQLQSGKTFDCLVIGGGATGASVALDAVSRGMSVACVEAEDFSSGTSSRSTKLIHGGIRYLENAFKKGDIGSFKLVMEALGERKHLIEAAPYTTRALPLIIPTYSWWDLIQYWVGCKVYDAMAGSRRLLPRSRFITATEALHQFPNLKVKGLKGAVVYYDGQQNDARCNLMIAMTAAQGGAAIANYVRVDKLLKGEDGKVCGATLTDVCTGKSWDIKARAVINATGPFTDAIRRMDDPKAPLAIVPAAGAHVVLPDYTSPDAMGLLVPKTRDGRVLFFLPWEGATLAGTTDAPAELTMLPKPRESDIEFVLSEANKFMEAGVTRDQVKAAWSGIRPLTKSLEALDAERAAIAAGQPVSDDNSNVSTKSLSRDHVLEVSPNNLVSIMGGKWTSARLMAEVTVDALNDSERFPRLQGRVPPSKTLGSQLLGADRQGIVVNRKYDRIAVTLREPPYNLHKDVAMHLMRNYGTRALQVGELARADPKLQRRLVERLPVIRAEVVFAARQELAVTAVDVLARRTRVAFVDSKAAAEAAPVVIDILAHELGWSSARKTEEAARVQEFLATME